MAVAAFDMLAHKAITWIERSLLDYKMTARPHSEKSPDPAAAGRNLSNATLTDELKNPVEFLRPNR